MTFRIDLVDPAHFSPDRVAGLRHTFYQHPLLQLDALEALAQRILPLGGCRFVEGALAPDSAFDHVDRPTDGRSLEAVFRDIERPGAWIALYEVQKDPTYAAFLESIRPSLQAHLGDAERIQCVKGFIFIGAPPAVTPFHIDREHNFWLQVRGQKALYVWDREDPRIVDPKDVEAFIISGGLQNITLTDMDAARRFECGPGDGVYFPSTTPHMTRSQTEWVRPGDGVAISIGLVFYTDRTRRDAHIHACNRALRKLRLPVSPPGASPRLDRLKAPLGRAVVKLRQRLRGYVPPDSYR